MQIIARNLIQSKQRVNTKKDNDSAADIEDLEDIEQDAGVQDEK